MHKSHEIIKHLISILKKHNWLIIVIFFIFIFIRNYHQLFLVDLNDGILAKIYLGQHGYDINTVKSYLKDFVFISHNQHFQPIWFCIYFILCFFDLNPIIFGVLTCFVAAAFCYLLFKLVITYSVNKNPAYAILLTLIFISTIMFTEILAWKWMLSLLLSSLGFLVCLKLIHNLKKWYLVVYLISLSIMVWCFSPSIIFGWCLVLYYFIYNKLEKKKIISLPFISSVSILVVATVLLIITNESTSKLNLTFLLVNTPSVLVLTVFSSIMALLGVYKFIEIWTPFTWLSIISGTILIFTYCFEIILKGRKYLPTKNYALITSMGIAYLLIIVLILLRIMPSYGLQYTQNPTAYITGNRYLFVFCIPLILILIYPLEKIFDRLTNITQYSIIFSIMILGFIISFSYSKIDPFLTSNQRTYFYYHTPIALNQAKLYNLVLPNTKSDILFQGGIIELKDSIYLRNDAKIFLPVFIDPELMKADDCNRLKNNLEVSQWLDSYNKEWCK